MVYNEFVCIFRSNLKGIVLKSLSAESGKNYLAAQILQRTLFLYCYKEHFSFYSVRSFSRAESGAKIKHLFRTTKTFRKFFQKNFSEPFCLSVSSNALSESGCKGNDKIRTCKHFIDFFQKKAKFAFYHIPNGHFY